MSKLTKILLWWFTFSLLWGLFRLTNPSEVVSELLAKPIIWLGITLFAFKLNFLPKQILTDLKSKYLQTKPILVVFIIPILCEYNLRLQN